MKLLFSSLFVLFFAGQIIGQTINFPDAMTSVKFPKGTSQGVVGEFDSGYVSYYTKKSSLVFFTQSESGKLSKGVEIKLTEGKEKLEFLEVVKLNNNELVIFSAAYDKQNQMESLFFRRIDASTFKPSNIELLTELEIVGKNKEGLRSFLWPSMKSRGFSVIKNENGEFGGIYHLSGAKNGSFVGYAIGIDDNLNATFETQVQVPFPNGSGIIDHAIVDAKKNMYLLTSSYEADGTSVKKVLVKVDSKGNEQYQLEISNAKDQLLNAVIQLNKDESILYLAGFGTEKDHKGATSSVFKAIDPIGGKIINEQVVPFSEEKLDAYLQYRRSGGNLDELKAKPMDEKQGYIYLSARKLHIMDNGTMVLEGAEQWTEEITTATANGSSTSVNYFDGLVLLVRFNSSLEEVNANVIQRTAMSRGRRKTDISYSSFALGNDIYLFYNSNNGNTNASPSNSNSWYIFGEYNVLLIAKIGEDASIEFKPMFEGAERVKALVPSSLVRTDDQQLIFPLIEKKSFGTAVIDL